MSRVRSASGLRSRVASGGGRLAVVRENLITTWKCVPQVRTLVRMPKAKPKQERQDMLHDMLAQRQSPNSSSRGVASVPARARPAGSSRRARRARRGMSDRMDDRAPWAAQSGREEVLKAWAKASVAMVAENASRQVGHGVNALQAAGGKRAQARRGSFEKLQSSEEPVVDAWSGHHPNEEDRCEALAAELAADADFAGESIDDIIEALEEDNIIEALSEPRDKPQPVRRRSRRYNTPLVWAATAGVLFGVLLVVNIAISAHEHEQQQAALQLHETPAASSVMSNSSR